MIYQLNLQTTGLATGLLLLLSHVFALVRPDQTIQWAKAFPRSRGAAGVLLPIVAVWSFLLVRSIDLGEFSPLRNMILVAIVVGTVLSWIYVPEFLAVRTLGMLLLLAAEPLLESAVLRHEPSRLLLVVIAYVWVIAGLFFVGMPYLLRDGIQWVTASRTRLKIGALAGVVYGLALVGCALAVW
ncbi:MAG: hypothetical protein IAE94_04785 [Chthoniobacterales bacterium]|nr:hypothetical protein [Chthoniobacterales bacterium]